MQITMGPLLFKATNKKTLKKRKVTYLEVFEYTSTVPDSENTGLIEEILQISLNYIMTKASHYY